MTITKEIRHSESVTLNVNEWIAWIEECRKINKDLIIPDINILSTFKAFLKWPIGSYNGMPIQVVTQKINVSDLEETCKTYAILYCIYKQSDNDQIYYIRGIKNKTLE